MHLVITDSGLGGLAACAAVENALRGRAAGVRITYFDAWPQPERGYNDMPDVASRAAEFDRALAGMAALRPDAIVIACNTLSVVYGHTAFERAPALPVLGIVDAGVGLFRDALAADAAASILLMGTRTTVESDVHRRGLVAKGVEPGRIAVVGCHGLARAIETDPDGPAVREHIDRCTRLARDRPPTGGRLYFGVCCTHYTYVRDEIRTALERVCEREVRTLDPLDRLVGETVRLLRFDPSSRPSSAGDGESVAVSVVSKVEMDDRKRRAIAGRVERVSPATSAALMAYTRVPDLF